MTATKQELPPLPNGYRIDLDPSAHQLAPDLWFGGSPARIVRLTQAGQAAWQNLQTGAVTTRAEGRLARKLTDAGLAHPRPPAARPSQRFTVVIPVHDRPDHLDRCLAAVPSSHRVIVVDDGSADASAVTTIAARYGATLIRREVNSGPAAARNTALASVTSELVAFIDSDCIPVPGWIEDLVPHFADPLVAAVAPRIVGLRPRRPPAAAGTQGRAAVSTSAAGPPGWHQERQCPTCPPPR